MAFSSQNRYLLTAGYCRKQQKSLMLLIPLDIIAVIFEFYPIMDYFATIGADVDVTNDGRTIAHTSGGPRSCYGVQEILSTSKKIHTWKLRIDNRDGACTTVGIHQSTEKRTDKGFCYHFNRSDANLISSTISYAYRCGGGLISQNQTKFNQNTYHRGQTVTMILDLSKGTFSFEVDNVPLRRFFSDIKQETDLYYVMAVYIYTCREGVTLLDYTVSTKRI